MLISPTDPTDFSTGGGQRSAFLHRALSQMGTVYTLVPVPLRRLEREYVDRRVAFRCMLRGRSLFWLIDRTLARFVPIIRVPVVMRPRNRCSWPDVRFDCVVVRYTQWAAYCRAWAIAPLVLDVDDLPSECFETMYRTPEGDLGRRFRDAILLWLVKRWSQVVFNRSVGLWIANRNQVEALDHPNVHWLPNLPRTPLREPSPADVQKDYILSIGYLGYAANYEGIDRFATRSWPAIRAKYPTLEYWIAGKDLPTNMRRKWEQIQGVRILGFIDDVEAVYRECLLTVAPIYVGSGTCIKVLESMRLGRVCVASPFAVRGLEGIAGELNGVLVGHTDEQMVAKVTWLLEHPRERQANQERGVKAAQSLWTFESFAGQVRMAMEATTLSPSHISTPRESAA